MDLKNIYLKEIEQLEAFGLQFLEGNLSRADFKKHAAGLGVYTQNCGTRFMVRLRIPAGSLSPHSLHTICEWAKSYSLTHIHLTTRQTIQFHHLTLHNAIELLRKALDIGITTKGAGGDFPRNIAVSPLSGTCIDEPFDVVPYVLMVDHYLNQRMYSYNLPRKLKISFSNTSNDTAHATVQDMGFIATTSEHNIPCFKLYIGGGLGKSPKKATLYPKLILLPDILYYIEALISLFIAEGDYENKTKGRIRYILDRMGQEVFFKTFEDHITKTFENRDLKCTVPTLETLKKGIPTNVQSPRLFAQKQKNLYSVYVHPVAGQLSLSDMNHVLSIISNYESAEIRLAIEESFYIINLNGQEADEVLALTESMGGHTQASYSVACVGKPICQIGILESQSLLTSILNALNTHHYTKDLLPKLYISGCPNSCGVHHIASIGFAGKKKRTQDGALINVYECFINGSVSEHSTHLATSIGDCPESSVVDFILWLYETLETENKPFTSWIQSNISTIQNKFMI